VVLGDVQEGGKARGVRAGDPMCKKDQKRKAGLPEDAGFGGGQRLVNEEKKKGRWRRPQISGAMWEVQGGKDAVARPGEKKPSNLHCPTERG